jgi:protein TonB
VQPPRSAAAPAPLIPPLTLDGYKKEFAEQVARVSPEIFSEPIPEMLKSVVVLDVTIDQEGRLQRIAVRRSNGYRALENLAMDSVRRAAPFAAPAWTVRRGNGSVNFLETFLFRADGRFQILSLVR